MFTSETYYLYPTTSANIIITSHQNSNFPLLPYFWKYIVNANDKRKIHNHRYFMNSFYKCFVIAAVGHICSNCHFILTVLHKSDNLWKKKNNVPLPPPGAPNGIRKTTCQSRGVSHAVSMTARELRLNCQTVLLQAQRKLPNAITSTRRKWNMIYFHR